MRVLLAIILLGLAAPAASAASASLYLHVADLANLDSIPMNVLPPPEDFTFSAGGGPGAATFSCLRGAGGPAQESHTVYGIAYAAATDDAAVPQMLRGEMRGLAYPLRGFANLTLHWYLETEAQAPLANVVVNATLRAGEDASAGIPGYERGTLLASGESGPAILAGSQSQGAEADTVDGRTVYHFTVPLAAAATEAPADGFNLRVEVRIDNPACAALDGMVMPPLARVHSSAGHRPRLDLSYADPLVVQEARMEESGQGTVRLRVTFNAVWGTYAVGNASVAVAGPGIPTGASSTLVLPDPATPGASPQSPAYAFWRWPAALEKAPAGDYRLDVTVSDVLGNTIPTIAVPFTLAEGEDHPPPSGQPSPGPAVPGIALALAAAALARQRKRA